MSTAITPAEELRAAATKLRETAAAARTETTTGEGDEWRPWYVIQNTKPDPLHVDVVHDEPWWTATKRASYVPTGEALVAHPQYAHNNEEDWYEAASITGLLPAPVAEWMALVHPGLAEPLAAWLEETARQYEMAPCDMPDGVCNSCERRDDFVYALAVARVINGSTSCDQAEAGCGGS